MRKAAAHAPRAIALAAALALGHTSALASAEMRPPDADGDRDDGADGDDGGARAPSADGDDGDRDDGADGDDGEAPVPSADDAEVPEVVVRATRARAELLDLPASVSVLERRDFRGDRPGIALDEAFARVPGAFAQNRYNFAQGLRLSVRGFGARAPFGVRGLAVRVDGIPATTPDGQSQLDGYDPAFVERMEVLRGPASALYGNAAGGVVRITTLRPPDAPRGEAQIMAGSEGQFMPRLHAGASGERYGAVAYGSIVDLDGHRDHDAAVRRRAGATITRDVGPSGRLRLTARALDAPESLDPGGLTREEFQSDPDAANSFNVTMDTSDSVAQQQAALSYRAEPAAGEVWQAQAYLQRRDFSQRIPVPPPGPGWIELDRLFGGAGARHARPFEVLGAPARITAGLDFGWQHDDRQRYENDFGDRGELRQDQLENARALGAYTQAELELGGSVSLSAGGRVDWLRLAVDDRFGDGEDDRSGGRSFLEPSAIAGVTWGYHDLHAAYANVATAFESPTFVELRNPDGDGRGFNPDLEAQDAYSGEVGAKGRLPAGAGRYDVAVFLADVRGELISYEEDGIDFFRNAGHTRRAGVEVSARGELLPGLEATAAVAAGRFRFRDYVDAEGEQHRGRAIPGVPSAHGYGGLSYAIGAFEFGADVRAAAGAPVDDANSDRGPRLVDVGLRATRRVESGGVRGRLTASVENLLNRTHAANVRINPAGDNPFEPAPGLTAYLAAALAWGSERDD